MFVTLDTNVLLSATLWDGSVAQKLLFDLINKATKIYISPEILSEYQKVLKRDFDFSDKEITEITEKIMLFVTIVHPNQKIDFVEEDPSDNIIIECAVESGSEYIITYDQHLLKLKEYKEIKIIRPEEAKLII